MVELLIIFLYFKLADPEIYGRHRNSQEKIEIYDATEKGRKELLLLDGPFNDINFLVEELYMMNMISFDKHSLSEKKYCSGKHQSGSYLEWEGDYGKVFEGMNNYDCANKCDYVHNLS